MPVAVVFSTEAFFPQRDDQAAGGRTPHQVVGDADRFRTAGWIVGAAVRVDSLDGPAQARYSPNVVECVDLKLIPTNHPFGRRVSAVSDEGAFRFIERR